MCDTLCRRTKKFPENVNVACKGHVSGNKKLERAIENEFNMQKLVKLTHFLFFVINLLLLSLLGNLLNFDIK